MSSEGTTYRRKRRVPPSLDFVAEFYPWKSSEILINGLFSFNHFEFNGFYITYFLPEMKMKCYPTNNILYYVVYTLWYKIMFVAGCKYVILISQQILIFQVKIVCVSGASRTLCQLIRLIRIKNCVPFILPQSRQSNITSPFSSVEILIWAWFEFI